MRALVVSHNLDGGAGGAAYLLHRGLLETGIDSHMLVQFDSRGAEGIHTAPTNWLSWRLAFRRGPIDRLPVRLYPDRVQPNSLWPLWLPSRLVPRRVEELAPDVINLHWILDGFLSIEQLAHLGRPLVWTMHDMWPFTGGCAYSLGCERHTGRCGACPVLGSDSKRDLSRAVWRRKERAWADLDITAVAPSRWLADQARRSSLFRDRRVEVIPTGIDTAVFKPMERTAARRLLNLPLDSKLVMFGAHDDTPRKGMKHLVDALRRLGHEGSAPGLAALVVGPPSLSAGIDVGLPLHALGRIGDPHAMAALYSAADVVVIPSVWENLPLVGLEALACGTPVVAFSADTGIVDIVDHEETGYLARPFEAEDLARGIEWVTADDDRHARLSAAARAKAERDYTLEVSARRYAEVFEEARRPR
ncbi:MAG TPA: glycosyltransferase family 4 protein [Thermoleophilaceae bacterium]